MFQRRLQVRGQLTSIEKGKQVKTDMFVFFLSKQNKVHFKLVCFFYYVINIQKSENCLKPYVKFFHEIRNIFLRLKLNLKSHSQFDFRQTPEQDKTQFQCFSTYVSF